MNIWNSLQRLPSVMPLWQWGVVIVMFALSIWTIVRLRSLFREDADDADVNLEMLTQFRELHQQGGLSNDEFRLIRSRLTRNVQEANVTGQIESKAIAASSVPLISQDSSNEASSQSPDNHAATEKLEKSDGNSDTLMQ